MKILQVIDSLPTGGGARFLVSSIPFFVKEGIETDLLLLDGTKFSFYKELEEKKCCNIYSLTIGNRWSPLNVFKIMPYLKNYDIVHVHIFPASYFVALANFFSFSKTKIVFTEHNSQNRRAVHPLFKYIEKFVYSQFSKIVCLTSQVSFFVKKNLNLRENKLIIIENGIDLNKVKSILPYSKIEMGYNEKEHLILMSARFEAQKDQDTLIKALKHLPDNFKVLFAGDGSRLEICKKLAANLNFSHRVNFLGNRDDIFQIMKMCDYNVLSSYFEGLSLYALEALASGKPFIASNVEGLDFIKDAGLLFDRGDDKELANIILHLYNNADIYNQTALRCMERAENYNIETMINNYIAIYKTLV